MDQPKQVPLELSVKVLALQHQIDTILLRFYQSAEGIKFNSLQLQLSRLKEEIEKEVV